MLHSFCVPEVHGDKQIREREVSVCQPSAGAGGGGLGCLQGLPRHACVLRWRNQEKLTQFPSICHHSSPRVVLPTCCWSPPFRALRCPWV